MPTGNQKYDVILAKEFQHHLTKEHCKSGVFDQGTEYYGINISVSIEGIALEHSSVLPKADINSTTPLRQRHAVFHSFLSDDSKQDAATTTAHSNRLISFLKVKKLLTTSLITIWGKLMVVSNNTDVPLNCTLCQLCLSATPL